MIRRNICRLIVGSLVVLVWHATLAGEAFSQHTRREIGASFAINGQYPFASDGTSGFFTAPFIWNLRYQLTTNYVQSLALVIEHIGETRSHSGLWTSLSSPPNPADDYNANIAERLQISVLSLEMIRTIFRTDIFRIGVGVGVGYGIGTATAEVEKVADHTKKTFDGQQLWTSFFLSAFTRARLSIYETDKLDFGITVTARYWGLPTYGPQSSTNSGGGYQGPKISSAHELGYLVGISVGLK